jgi:hypothetical protein
MCCSLLGPSPEDAGLTLGPSSSAVCQVDVVWAQRASLPLSIMSRHQAEDYKVELVNMPLAPLPCMRWKRQQSMSSGLAPSSQGVEDNGVSMHAWLLLLCMQCCCYACLAA